MLGNGLGKVYFPNLLWFTCLVVIREPIVAGPLFSTTAEIPAILTLWPQAAPILHTHVSDNFLKHLESYRNLEMR